MHTDPLEFLDEGRFREFLSRFGLAKSDIQTKEQIQDEVVNSKVGKLFLKADPKTRFDFLKLAARHDTERYLGAFKLANFLHEEGLEFVDGSGGIKRSDIAKAYNESPSLLQSDFLTLIAQVTPEAFKHAITAAREDVEREQQEQ